MNFNVISATRYLTNIFGA